MHFHLYTDGGAAPSDNVSKFFVRLYKSDEVILSYFEEDLCKMTGNLQVSGRQSAKRGLCAVLP